MIRRTCHQLKLFVFLLFLSLIHEKLQTINFTNQCTFLMMISKRIWTAYCVHWCDLLHCVNVLLPSTENYSYNRHIPIGPKDPRGNMRVSEVILALGNMTLPQCNKLHHCTLQQSMFVYCSS